MKRTVSVSGAMTFAQTIRSCQFWERSSLMSPLWHSQQLLRPVFKRMFYISWRWQSQNGWYCSVMFSAMIACLLFFQSPGSGAGGRGCTCQNSVLRQKVSVSKQPNIAIRNFRVLQWKFRRNSFVDLQCWSYSLLQDYWNSAKISPLQITNPQRCYHGFKLFKSTNPWPWHFHTIPGK